MNLTTNFGQYLLKILPIINYNYNRKELSINIPFNKLIPIIFFLKNHTNCQYKVLSDLCIVDYITKKERFEMIYNLLSIRFNTKIRIKTLLNELTPINTIQMFLNVQIGGNVKYGIYSVFFLHNIQIYAAF